MCKMSLDCASEIITCEASNCTRFIFAPFSQTALRVAGLGLLAAHALGRVGAALGIVHFGATLLSGGFIRIFLCIGFTHRGFHQLFMLLPFQLLIHIVTVHLQHCERGNDDLFP